MSRVPSSSKNEKFPLILALLATFGTVYFFEGATLRQTGGAFIYPLDDPFIHMQIARNLAFHGTWGINPHEFGSASSSLLYTVILAAFFKLFAAQVLIPFIINCAAAVVLLAVLDRWLRRQEIGVSGRCMILLAIVFLVPLPTLIVSGMEHVLQCLFSFLFVTGFADWAGRMRSGGKDQRWVVPVPILLYGAAVVAIRYEGLFLVFLAGLLLLYYRKLAPAVVMGGLALLPIVVFGLWSLQQGSYFLPNSVLVKSESAPFSLSGLAVFFNNIFVNKLTIVKAQPGLIGAPPPGISLLATQRLLIILPLVFWLFRGPLAKNAAYRTILILLAGCTVLHLAFAATGWFYRYEAYLIVCVTAIAAVLLVKYGREVFAHASRAGLLLMGLLVFALVFPFLLRSSAACAKATRACLNIYQQQYQMGQFIHTYYDRDTVAANDIGAISYASRARIVDLWGLGSIEVARSKKGHYWTPNYLDSLVRGRGVRLAVVYDEWFDPTLLHRWTKLATWQIPENVICGSDIVSFYAIRAEDAAGIRANLEAFSASLPQEVRVVNY